MSVSEVQRRQMTTVIAPNIHNLAIQGNFDDCQAMVKASFVAEPSYPMADVLLLLIRSTGLASWLRSFTTFTRARLGSLGCTHEFFSAHRKLRRYFCGLSRQENGFACREAGHRDQ